MFTRVAIVNRGEPAARLIRAVRELGAEWGADLTSIALHTPAEAGAMFVSQADEAVRIGARGDHAGPEGGEAPANPYLDYSELERALLEARADAVWPGWGFVAEHPEFAALCRSLGMVFIGPDAEVMHRLGDKIESKQLAEKNGVPVAPWSRGPVETLAEAREQAAAIGYPLAIKATAGGGGRGIRTVQEEAELEDAFERGRSEAQRAFGDPAVLLERVLPDARHVEVQIAADDGGGVWALGVRDCSIQRRRQKVIEESSSTTLTADQEQRLRTAAADLVRDAGYQGVGTVEFLYQPAEDTFTFLEVNPRLQVEHPVTEFTTGQDLVKLQLHLAGGGGLDGRPPASSGHAIEARLNAENPDRGFAPAPGTVELLTLPAGPGVRVDTGLAEGDEIPPEYDSMIAKVVAWGRNRPEARVRLQRAVGETSVVIRGGTTNKAFLLDLLDHPDVRSGDVHTGWLDSRDSEVPPHYAHVGLLVAAIDAYDAEAALDRSRFYQSAARGRPQTRADSGGAGSARAGCVSELRHRDQGYELEVAQLGPSSYRIAVDGHHIDVELERLRRFEARVKVAGRTFRVLSRVDGVDHLVEVDGIEHRYSPDEGGIVRSPAPAMVIATNVAPDEVVEPGTSLAALESMKMELPVPAPVGGRVSEVLVTPNVQVAAGEPLIRLEPTTEDGAAVPAAPAERLEFGELVATPEPDEVRLRVLERLLLLRSMVMGYDVDAADARQVAEEYEELRRQLPPDDLTVPRAELHTLQIFADLCVLSRKRRAADQEERAQTRGPREHLHAYLRSLDVDAEGIPTHFQNKLRAALAHYGVLNLERTPALEEAAYRMFRAVQSASDQIPAVRALLDVWLAAAPPEGLAQELLETLERLTAATQLRYPLVGDLARSVRYRRFDAPFIDQARSRVFAAMREDLDYLSTNPDAPDYADRIEHLVATPQPLIRLLAERAREPGPQPHDPMLEVLTRRFYRTRPLQRLRSFYADELQLVAGEYTHHQRRTHVIATLSPVSRVEAGVAAVAGVAREVSSPDPVLADIYAWSDQPDTDPDELAARVAAALNRVALPATTERVAVAVAGRDASGGSDADGCVHQFTFRRGSEGFREERATRGMHPMVAERLQLWRLANFAIERLPSAEDTYLFHCMAHDNPDDERLIAFGEVRDLTPERDAQGRMTGLPELERVLGACLEAIRQAHAERPPERRMHWNRVLLYVWPQVEAPLDELLEVARGLVPLTEGLGLEEVQAQGRLPQPPHGELQEKVLHLSSQPGVGLTVRLTDPPTDPLRPLDEYTQKVLKCRQRGQVYPFELLGTLTQPRGETAEAGSFTEYDLDEDACLVQVSRPYGQNSAGIIVGVLRTPTERYPEGIARVVLFGDPTKALGSLAEPECRRIMAALDLAIELRIPVDWFALSAGAKIAMDSGSENMDWVALVLRRLVQFTQAGGEVNAVVAGINVGAQPYWNAEATMLMHTRGILVMTPESAMVLTGKQALDFSGGVSAEDNVGIGGYERVMGPNGQAQYWVPDVTAACALLAEHHEHGYVAPGERFPRRAKTEDPAERDVRDDPHPTDGSDFTRVGDIFSDAANPERKKPFDMRALMRAIADRDQRPLERWAEMADAETAVVLEAHLGGRPVTMLGIESRPLPRYGFLPPDGPDHWTAGTLFPLSSKKAARALNAASGKLPAVVVANLTGFDGSPESLRNLQLEYGAEIGRAIVNFDGPIVLCVVSRYHGGAFVVFSAALNDDMEVAAVEGSYASVIGGAPAAAVVFGREVSKRTHADPRVRDLHARVEQATGGERATARSELEEASAAVHAEKLGEMAAEFDATHSVERARRVGSVHRIIPSAELRPYLIGAVERGIRRTLARQA